MKLLLDVGANARVVSKVGSVMSQATLFGHAEVVALLLHLRPEIDFNRLPGCEPVLLVAATGGHCVLAAQILAREDSSFGDVNIRDRFGNTALHKAAVANQLDFIASVLLPHHIDINAKDTVYEETALLKACRLGHESIARLLLEQDGIDAAAKNRSGDTALSLTRFNFVDLRARLAAAGGGMKRKGSSKAKARGAKASSSEASSSTARIGGSASHVNGRAAMPSVLTAVRHRALFKSAEEEEEPFRCGSDEVAVQQSEELETLSAIFGAEISLPRAAPRQAGDLTGCAVVQLLCLDNCGLAPKSWVGKLRLCCEFGPFYPEEGRSAHGPRARVSIRTGEVSMLEAPDAIEDLEALLVAGMRAGNGLFECVHIANEWLESGQWLSQEERPLHCLSDEIAAQQRQELLAASFCCEHSGALSLRHDLPSHAGDLTGGVQCRLPDDSLCAPRDSFGFDSDEEEESDRRRIPNEWWGRFTLCLTMGSGYPSKHRMMRVRVTSSLSSPHAQSVAEALKKHIQFQVELGLDLFECIESAGHWFANGAWTAHVSSFHDTATAAMGRPRKILSAVNLASDSYLSSLEELDLHEAAPPDRSVGLKLGREIARARLARGMSQADLAARVCVRKQLIQQYESGQGIRETNILRRIKKELDNISI